MFDLQPVLPVRVTDWQQRNPTTVVADQCMKAAHQLTLMIAAELPTEGAELDAIEAVVKAGIGHLSPDLIAGDIVDQDYVRHHQLALNGS